MNLTWMLARGSGFAAFGMLALSAIWGLVLSLGVLPRAVKRLTMTHEALAVAALAATLVHMGALYLDGYIDFGATDLLVPGAASWQPIAVAWGVFAFYGTLIVTASFYVRKHIGQRAWRLLHFLTFGVFLSALVHGLMAGTDSGNPVVRAMYVAVAAAVIGLVTVRIATVVAGSPGGTASRRPAPDRSTRTRIPAAARAQVRGARSDRDARAVVTADRGAGPGA